MVQVQSHQDSLNCTCDVDDWFDTFVAHLRADQVQLLTNLATKEKSEFYNLMMSGDMNRITHASRNMTSVQFIKSIIFEYIQELNSRQCRPANLAFNFSDAKVLVWAVISDNDEKTEDDLLMAEAKVNAKYHQYGFHISSTILEQSDNYPTPPHYKSMRTN